MAIGWLTLLKAVPWIEVAKKAPEVAESAKKLWSAIANKSSKPEIEVYSETALFSSKEQEIMSLKVRLTAIEAAHLELHNQMLASAELIKTLAEQNTQLINSIDMQRKKLFRLVIFVSTVSLIVLYSLMIKFL